MRKLKSLFAGVAVAAALAVPAMASAAPALPEYAAPNCSGHYHAWIIDLVDDATPLEKGGGLAAVADFYGFTSVKDLKIAIDSVCGKGL